MFNEVYFVIGFLLFVSAAGIIGYSWGYSDGYNHAVDSEDGE